MATRIVTKKATKQVWRIAAPLALLTAIGMLATDLYLPAVPQLPKLLGGTIEQAQLTLASCLATLAISQILWGWASDKFGESVVLNVGMYCLILGSVMGAMSQDIFSLIIARAIQGLGAGAATAAVPSLLRKKFNEADAVRSIAAVGIAESIIPALGPVLGAILISLIDWRFTFWIIAILTLILFPLVRKVTGGKLMGSKDTKSPLFAIASLLKNITYRKLALSYAIQFAALLMFVASAPQLVVHTFQRSISDFSILQILGVSSFIFTASQGTTWMERLSSLTVLRAGSGLQILAACILVLYGIFGWLNFIGVCLAWSFFCAGLGLRAPSGMAEALGAAKDMTGQASGFLMFLSFGLSAIATAAIAPFLLEGMLPISVVMLLFVGLSVFLAKRS